MERCARWSYSSSELSYFIKILSNHYASFKELQIFFTHFKVFGKRTPHWKFQGFWVTHGPTLTNQRLKHVWPSFILWAIIMLIFLSLMKMDTPSENSISWGGIIFVALARNVLVLRFRSAIGENRWQTFIPWYFSFEYRKKSNS